MQRQPTSNGSRRRRARRSRRRFRRREKAGRRLMSDPAAHGPTGPLHAGTSTRCSDRVHCWRVRSATSVWSTRTSRARCSRSVPSVCSPDGTVPACGGLRMVHDVLHGDLAAAINDNVVLLSRDPAAGRMGPAAPPQGKVAVDTPGGRGGDDHSAGLDSGAQPARIPVGSDAAHPLARCAKRN